MGEQMTPAKVSKWETPTSTHNIHHFTQGRASVDISSHWTSSLQGGSICRGCRLGCADWQVSGVTTLVTPVTSVPPLLLSTGPSRHHRRDRYCNQHRLHNTKYTLNFGFIIIFCNVQIIFWMYKNIFAVVSNSGLSSAGAGAGVWRAERRVRTSVTTFSVTNGQGIPNEASPRRHNYTLHQPEIRHVSIVRQNTRRRSRLAFIPQSNWVVCLQQCMP